LAISINFSLKVHNCDSDMKGSFVNDEST